MPRHESAIVVKYVTGTHWIDAGIVMVISLCGVAAAMAKLLVMHKYAASASPCGSARVAVSFLGCVDVVQLWLTGAMCATTRGHGCAANVILPASGGVYAIQAHAPAQ